jgi:hypothetical protein
VVTVAGNQGEAGAFLQNTPGTGKHVVSVASVDNSIFPTKVMNVDSIPDEPFGKPRKKELQVLNPHLCSIISL